MLLWFLNPASFESNDQAERIQILFQGAFIVRTTSTFVRMQHNKHKLMKQPWMGWSACPVSFWLPSFFAVAPGAYRQVPAPRAQRSGSEKLHEHSGESGTERWVLSLFSAHSSRSASKLLSFVWTGVSSFRCGLFLWHHIHIHTCLIYTKTPPYSLFHMKKDVMTTPASITEGIPSLNTSRAKIRPPCSLVCTTRWGNEGLLHL